MFFNDFLLLIGLWDCILYKDINYKVKWLKKIIKKNRELINQEKIYKETKQLKLLKNTVNT